MKTLLLFITTFLNISILYSQDYRILSQLKINENASFTTLQYNRKEYGIGIMNNKGAIINEQNINSIPIHAGIMGENILLIGSEDKRMKTLGYNALLINKKNCAVIREQNIFNKENSNKITTTLLKDANNNTCYVLLRQTNYNEGFQFFGPSNYDTKFLESTSLELIKLNNKLEATTININTVASKSFYGGAIADDSKNIYICSFTNEMFTVEQFDSTGKILKTLSSPISIKEKSPAFSCVIKNEKDNQQNIIISTTYNNSSKKSVLQNFKFDFINNKIFSTSAITLNKQYRQSLKNANEETNAKSFSAIESLEPIQIIDDDKRIVFVNEIKTFVTGIKSGDATTYYRNGSIISVYNKNNFELERDIVINKNWATFVEQSNGISVHLLDNKLWVIICENAGLISYKTYLQKINLSTGEITKEEVEKGDAGKSWITYPVLVGWFKKNFVVPFFTKTSPFAMKFETTLITKEY